MGGDDYDKLEDGGGGSEDKRARIGFLNPPAYVLLNSIGQHALEWEEPLCADGVVIEPGSLNLYIFPGGFSGPKLALIRRIMLELIRHHSFLFDTPDPVGAFIIHALIVCNTEASLELSFAILDIAPRLLLQTHAGQPFSGEGSIHIVCANRREELGIRMIEIAQKHFTEEEQRSFLSTQAVGVFFESPPMCWYGESPLGYACCFGLKRLVRKMLDTGLVTLNSNVGEIVGYYPVHAVVANGNREMYDFLVGRSGELPEELRAEKLKLTETSRMVSWNMDGMSPLQLSSKRGMRRMFQHIMKNELMTILWVWGPVTQYQIRLEGVDSSGDGASDVMEILIRQDASMVSMAFVLDDFMAGFLFTLYQQKWLKYGWYIHFWIRILDLVITVLCAYLGMQIKAETDTKEQYFLCYLMLVMMALFLLVEGWIGYLFADNMRGGIPPMEVFKRTWAWMNSFMLTINLTACCFIACGILVYVFEDAQIAVPGVKEVSHVVNEAIDSVLRSAAEAYEARQAARVQEAGRRLYEFDDDDGGGSSWFTGGGHDGIHDDGMYDGLGRGGVGGGPNALHGRSLGGLPYTVDTELQRVKAVYDWNLHMAHAAAWEGTEPLMWLFMGLGFLLKFYAFFDQLVQPFMSLYCFMISINQVLAGDLLIFMSIFMCLIIAFVFTMIVIFPAHPLKGALPQVEDFTHWTIATYSVLMAGFTGEPLEMNLHPHFLAPLGSWQKFNLFVFTSMYFIYIFMSMILLLNLLIALLGSTFSKTQEESVLQSRMAYARIVLRLELVAEFFEIQTNAGLYDPASDAYVHQFRDVVRDPKGELPQDYKDENVFDADPEAEAAAAKATADAAEDADDLPSPSPKKRGGGGGANGRASVGSKAELASKLKDMDVVLYTDVEKVKKDVVGKVAQGMLEVMAQVSESKSMVNAGLANMRDHVDAVKEEVMAALAHMGRLPTPEKMPVPNTHLKMNMVGTDDSSASKLASERLERSRARGVPKDGTAQRL